MKSVYKTTGIVPENSFINAFFHIKLNFYGPETLNKFMVIYWNPAILFAVPRQFHAADERVVWRFGHSIATSVMRNVSIQEGELYEENSAAHEQ